MAAPAVLPAWLSYTSSPTLTRTVTSSSATLINGTPTLQPYTLTLTDYTTAVLELPLTVADVGVTLGFPYTTKGGEGPVLMRVLGQTRLFTVGGNVFAQQTFGGDNPKAIATAGVAGSQGVVQSLVIPTPVVVAMTRAVVVPTTAPAVPMQSEAPSGLSREAILSDQVNLSILLSALATRSYASDPTGQPTPSITPLPTSSSPSRPSAIPITTKMATPTPGVSAGNHSLSTGQVAGIAIGSLVGFGLLLLLALFCFRRRLRQQSKGGPGENYTEKSGGEGKVWNKFGTRRREDVWGSRDRELEEDGYGDLGTRGREDYEEGEEGRFLNPQPRSTAGAFLYKLASPTFPTLATFITKSLSPRIPSPSHLSPAHFPAEERSLLSSVPSFHDDDEDSIDVPPRSNQAGWIAAAGATGRLATMARKRSKQPLSSDRDDEAVAVEGLIGRRERKKSDRMVGRVKGSREMLEEGTWMKGKEGEEGSSPDDVVWRGSRGGPSPKLDDLYGATPKWMGPQSTTPTAVAFTEYPFLATHLPPLGASSSSHGTSQRSTPPATSPRSFGPSGGSAPESPVAGPVPTFGADDGLNGLGLGMGNRSNTSVESKYRSREYYTTAPLRIAPRTPPRMKRGQRSPVASPGPPIIPIDDPFVNLSDRTDRFSDALPPMPPIRSISPNHGPISLHSQSQSTSSSSTYPSTGRHSSAYSGGGHGQSSSGGTRGQQVSNEDVPDVPLPSAQGATVESRDRHFF